MHLILGYAPGAAPDIVCRLMGQWLSERLGQPFVVENRPGAGSNLGTEAVVRAPADGYTLLYTTTANATNATLYPGATSPSLIYPQVSNNLLDTKFKIIAGYPGGADINIAVERHELDVVAAIRGTR